MWCPKIGNSSNVTKRVITCKIIKKKKKVHSVNSLCSLHGLQFAFYYDHNRHQFKLFQGFLIFFFHFKSLFTSLKVIQVILEITQGHFGSFKVIPCFSDYEFKLHFGKTMTLAFIAVRLHAISPISMKLCQFKGSTPKLKKTNWFLFWFFLGGDRQPPGFSWFSLRKLLQNR